MGALTAVYVAGTSGSNTTGTGTSGNPYQTVQHVLNNVTKDTTNGNVIYLSGINVLSAALSIATWTGSTPLAPTLVKNWAGGPDGNGKLDGNNGGFQIATNLNSFSFYGLWLTNTGGVAVVELGNESECVGCEISVNSGGNLINFYGSGAGLINCYCHSGGRVSSFAPGSFVRNCYITTAGSLAVLYLTESYMFVHGNIILPTDPGTHGIRFLGQRSIAQFNSVLGVSNTASGIFADGVNAEVMNNLVEGFSGVGGIGINTNNQIIVRLNNAVYNCATSYSGDTTIEDDSEVLSATPFAKSGSNTFANRFTYFVPVNTGNVWAGAYPVGSGLDKGAIQHTGGGAAPPNFNIIPQSA